MARMTLTPGFDYGDFHIESLLGKGAMAEVYLATDRRNGNEIALKVLTRGFADARARLQRFEREAKAIALTNHPNIVAIYEVGSYNRTPYIAMEYVDGPTLRDVLDAGRIAPARALDIARQIAAGLASAHRCGIVHRDLKPDNVMIASDGTVKILDFGLSKPLSHCCNEEAEAGDEELTLPGTILGTLEYMSPEQASGQPVDFRSDQFTFGAIFHEILSGAGAFRAESPARVIQAVMKAGPAPLPTSVPEPLRRIVAKTLQRSADDRYASMDDVVAALDEVAPPADRGRTTMLALCGIVLAVLGAAFLI